MTVTIGANIGEALEQAKETQGKDITVHTPATAVKPSARQGVDQSLQLVGIEMTPNDPEGKRITLDAQQHQKGKIFVGPTAPWAWIHADYTAFVSGIRTYTLQLNKFSLNPSTGKIHRGSLVCEPTGAYHCPNCKHELRVAPAEYKKMQKAQKTKHPYCAGCYAKDGSKHAYRWKADAEPKLSPGDPRLKRMWEALVASREEPAVETVILAPRVWAVSALGQASTEYVPDVNDKRALRIEELEQAQGFTIRPFLHGYKSESRAIEALLMESTLDESGKPGMAIGWMSQDNLNGGLVNSDHYGYTVRLTNRKRNRRREAAV